MIALKAPAKGFKYVRIVDYAQYDENGRLIGLQCKLCGTVMGEVTAKVIGRKIQDDGRIVEQVETRFRRNQHFGQLLIKMEDGSNHETALCAKCCAGNLKPAILGELVRADAIEQRWEALGLGAQINRKPLSMMRMDLRKMGGGE